MSERLVMMIYYSGWSLVLYKIFHDSSRYLNLGTAFHNLDNGVAAYFLHDRASTYSGIWFFSAYFTDILVSVVYYWSLCLVLANRRSYEQSHFSHEQCARSENIGIQRKRTKLLASSGTAIGGLVHVWCFESGRRL